MRIKRRLLALAVLLALTGGALTLPAMALAQSAGDDQYVDPFQDQQGQGQGGNGQGGGDGGDEPAPTPEQPAEQAPAAPAPTESAQTPVTPTQDGSSTLPRTGLPLGALAVAGALLLGAGAALRRRA
jgi:hypothetical protein